MLTGLFRGSHYFAKGVHRHDKRQSKEGDRKSAAQVFI